MRLHRLILSAFTAALLLTPAALQAAVTPGQIDEFNLMPTSTYGWTNDAGGDGIANIDHGGPNTSNPNDHYLQISAGNLGGQGDLTAVADDHWLGNFSNIAGIKLSLKNFDTNVPAQSRPIRIALRESSFSGEAPGYATDPAYTLPADNAWHTVFIPLTALNLTAFDEPQPLAVDLTNVADLRILSAADPVGVGDSIFPGGRIGIDNITAVPKGDWNQDGSVTPADIQVMLKGLADLSAYKMQKNLNDVGLLAVGDFNLDGQITNADIQPMLDFIAATGGGSITAVPEPAMLVPACCVFAAFVWFSASVRRKNRDIS